VDWIEVYITRRAAEAHSIVSLELMPVDGGELPSFESGAHIDVQIETDLLRQYSLCNDSAERHRYLIAVLNTPDSRGGSKRLHETFLEGRRIRIGKPRNSFPLSPSENQTVLAAGGIGITPLLCMAYKLSKEKRNFELHYCARSRSSAAFVQNIQFGRLASRSAFYFDDENGSPKLVLPSFVEGMHLYICGPSGFMHHVLNLASGLGWPTSCVHTEFFEQQARPVDARPFVVRAARSNVSIPVSTDMTIANALSKVGIEVPLSCEVGVCGTCLTRVISGTPDHLDTFQTDEEKCKNTHIAVCCSRSLSDELVLDL